MNRRASKKGTGTGERERVETYACMECGKEGSGSLVTYKKRAYERFPAGWAHCIQPAGDYLLVCETCVARDRLKTPEWLKTATLGELYAQLQWSDARLIELHDTFLVRKGLFADFLRYLRKVAKSELLDAGEYNDKGGAT